MQTSTKHLITTSDFYYDKAHSTGEMPNMHYHEHYEIYYILTGERNHFVGNRLLKMEQGDLVAVPPQTPHKTGGYGGWRILLVFNQNFLSRWLTPQAQKEMLRFFERVYVRPEKEKQHEILALLQRIEKAYKESEADVFSALIRLFCIFNDSPSVKNESSYSTELLHRAMEYVQKNYAFITNLEEVAEALYVSKYYLCHVFSKYVEISFNRYLTQIRLKNASEQLKTTAKTVSEIALNCGFNTSTYFCQVFKKEFRTSPLQYRKFHQKEN